MKNLYEILDVPKDASESDIKKAYRKKAQTSHPDKDGGDEELFKAVQKAYEILSDANKRKHYDETGEESKDNLNNDVIESLIGIVLNVVQGNDVKRNNILATAITLVHRQQDAHRSKRKQAELEHERLVEAASRISCVEGKENILKLALESQANRIKMALQEIDKVLSIGEEILVVIADYSYETDQMPTWGTGQTFQPWFSNSTTG